MTNGREVPDSPSSWCPTEKFPPPRVQSRRVSVVRALLSPEELAEKHQSEKPSLNSLSTKSSVQSDESAPVEPPQKDIDISKSETKSADEQVVYTDDLRSPLEVGQKSIRSTPPRSQVPSALRKSPPRSRSRSASAAALLAELAQPGRWEPPTLAVDGISQEFKTHSEIHRVLDGIQLVFNAPGIHVLFGPPGCGKSVLLRLMSGKSMSWSEGEIRVCGERVRGFSRDIISLGAVENNRPDLTVLENVMLPFKWRVWADSVSRSEQRLRIKRVLDNVGLSHAVHGYPHELSLDQNLCLVWARALVLKPKILLVDDPFRGVDALHRIRLRDLVRKLILQQSCTVILATNDLSEAIQLADRLVVLSPTPARVCLDFSIPPAIRKTAHWPNSPEAEQLRSRLMAHLSQWPAFAC